VTEAPQSASSELVRLGSVGPITVSAQADEVAAFRAETGWRDHSAKENDAQEVLVLHTFPMRWLSLPPVKSVLEETIKSLGAVAFHESQSFAYEAPLAVGETYLMDGSIDRQAEPARLILQVRVTKNGVLVLAMETILRLVFTGAPA